MENAPSVVCLMAEFLSSNHTAVVPGWSRQHPSAGHCGEKHRFSTRLVIIIIIISLFSRCSHNNTPFGCRAIFRHSLCLIPDKSCVESTDISRMDVFPPSFILCTRELLTKFLPTRHQYKCLNKDGSWPEMSKIPEKNVRSRRMELTSTVRPNGKNKDRRPGCIAD